MSMQSTLSDMVTKLRNASLVRHATVVLPYSKLNRNVLNILKQEGYIENFEEITKDNRLFLHVTLKYFNGTSVIKKIKQISTPGMRVYKPVSELSKILSGLGTAILSTSKGIMTDHQARKDNHGGELLLVVY